MRLFQFLTLAFAAALFSCSSGEQSQSNSTASQTPADGGQAAVQDDISQQNIVQVASGSADHTTLVAALKAADYVDALANAGPFTVFAPTNEAFNQLPAGTVDNLLKPENKDQLRDVLENHVYIGVMRENMMRDGQKLNQANMKNVILAKNGDKISVNGANIIATIPCSNGIVYVIDKVLVPEQ
ncbi:MAG: fasciclin domain-containing protein [Cyclobacteriaceae bacterium]|nr:fasciclin domain-containing protein [Cyclobacteriaceae bacterium]